jgi:hypothetical protein
MLIKAYRYLLSVILIKLRREINCGTGYLIPISV